MKIAVIGSGVAGLSTVWLLNEYSQHQVHLFEADDRVGGHTNTQPFTPPPAGEEGLEPTHTDTGFIVFNRVTYPNFLRFCQTIDAPILESDMSFSVSRSAPASTKKGGLVRGVFEWAGGDLGALFCQKSNLLDPAHWRMVWDIVRFNYQALQTLRAADDDLKRRQARSRSRSTSDSSSPAEEEEPEQESIGAWLSARGYSPAFLRNYLIPMTACIWSSPPGTALSLFPAVTLLRFMHNHHLLQLLDRPQWLTLRGGSARTYVPRVLARLPTGRLHTGAAGHVLSAWPVTQPDTQQPGWAFRTKDGCEHTFDRLVFATHADLSLQILADALDKITSHGAPALAQEATLLRDALAAFHFSKNSTVLHADTRLMPVRRKAWSAWNFLATTAAPTPTSTSTSTTSSKSNGSRKGIQSTTSSAGAPASVDEDRVTLTYWMNLLQSLPEAKHGPVLVTLNPPSSVALGGPRPELVIKEQAYEHPIYTPSSVRAQNRLERLQMQHGHGPHAASSSIDKDEQGDKADLGVLHGLHFAGAWLKYGFHEDGFSSGMRAAIRLGAAPPFHPEPAERPVRARDAHLGASAIGALEFARRAVAGATLAPLLYTLLLLVRLAQVLVAVAHSVVPAQLQRALVPKRVAAQVQEAKVFGEEVLLRWREAVSQPSSAQLWKPTEASS